MSGNTAHNATDKMREVRLKWCGRFRRRDEEYMGSRMLEGGTRGTEEVV